MLERLRSFSLQYLVADVPPLSAAERWRSTMATLIGLLIATALAWFSPLSDGNGWLVAPIGATAIILFALPHSPLAQPWSVLGGYFAATLAATVCIAILPDHPAIAAVFAVAATVGLMTRFRCLHPPGGALAFIVVFGGGGSLPQALHTFAEIGLDAAFLMIAALLVNNLLFRRRYPHCRTAPPANPHQTRDAPPTARTGLTHADLAAALTQLDTFIDIQENDLVRIYNHAVDHAFNRHLAMTCGDIMARDVVTVEFATDLQEAWTQLRAYKIKALPVVDRNSRRLLGIVTVADFLKQIDATRVSPLAGLMQGLLRKTPGVTSEKAEVIGQIMTPDPFAARPDTPIVELVKLLSDAGMHHIPVVDEHRRVLGMLTQSDLIAALYKQVALAHSAAPAG